METCKTTRGFLLLLPLSLLKYDYRSAGDASRVRGRSIAKIPWIVKTIDPGGIPGGFYLKKWGAETARYPHPSSWDG
jgi:hypothetical protein